MYIYIMKYYVVIKRRNFVIWDNIEGIISYCVKWNKRGIESII